MTVHLNFTARPLVHNEIERQDGDEPDAIDQHLEEALKRIKQHRENPAVMQA